MQEINDKDILRIYREGNKHYAFNLLAEKYKERLYWHIRRLAVQHEDSDDILQNTLVKCWQNLDGFREESTLFTWLYRIATNETITFLNKKKRRFLIPLVNVERDLSEKLSSDPYFSGDALQLKLQKAILSLPEKQRVVFNMKYYDEIKYEEMAEILQTSVGALKASYHHAVKKIEKYILEH